MLPGRAALAAIVAAGLLAGGEGQLLAQSPTGGGATQKPTEASPPKAAENGTEKRAEESAPKRRLMSILGREVTNRDGDTGRVIDVLVDLDGGSGAVVVEFGGFMGIGSRKVAVEWNALHFVREGDRTSLVVDITRNQIRDAAEYKPNEPTTVLTTK